MDYPNDIVSDSLWFLNLHMLRSWLGLSIHPSVDQRVTKECRAGSAPGQVCMTNMAATESAFEAFLKSINLAEEYFEQLKKTGFEDIDLVKSLEPEELQNMFDLVGLSAKPGHVLKFNKAVNIAQHTDSVVEGSIPCSVPQKKV